MGTITDLLGGSLLFNDGEGLDYTDLNRMQTKWARAIFDSLLLNLAPNEAFRDPDGADDFTPELATTVTSEASGTWGGELVYAPTPGTGHWFAGGSARTLVNGGGPFMVLIDAADAPTDQSAFVLVNLGWAAALTLTTAAGDATNPRIDLVEVKVEWVDATATSRDFKDGTTGAVTTITPYKDRALKATYQIKQGTPASAATVTYPVCMTGYRAMAAVYVPATHNAVHSPSNIRDLRFPLGGLKTYDVNSYSFVRQGANPWTLTDFHAVAPATPSAIYVPCPVQSKTARVVGIGLYGVCAGSAQVDLVKILHDGTGMPTETVLASFGADLYDTAGFRMAGVYELMDYLGGGGDGTPGSMTFNGQRAAATGVGSPLWCAGDTAGAANPLTAGTFLAGAPAQLALKVNGAATSKLHLVRWLVAHGL